MKRLIYLLLLVLTIALLAASCKKESYDMKGYFTCTFINHSTDTILVFTYNGSGFIINPSDSVRHDDKDGNNSIKGSRYDVYSTGNFMTSERCSGIVQSRNIIH